MPVTATNFLTYNNNRPTVMTEAGGYLVCIFGGSASGGRPWAAFNLSTQTSLGWLAASVGSSGATPLSLISYGGYAWYVYGNALYRLNPVTGGTTVYTLDHGNTAGSPNPFVTLVGSTAYVMYVGSSPNLFYSINMATQVSSLINSDTNSRAGNQPLYAGGDLWFREAGNARPSKITLGGTVTNYAAAPSGGSRNFAQVGNFIYWMFGSTWSRMNIVTLDFESWSMSSGPSTGTYMIAGSDGRVYSISNLIANRLWGLDPSTGQTQDEVIPGAYTLMVSGQTSAIYQRPNGEIWIGQGAPNGYP